MHAIASALATAAGIGQDHAQAILNDAARRNPMLLIGGYHADYFIIATWLALMEEDGLSQDEVDQRVDAAIAAAWGDLV